ncbi:hypothetical protein BJF83_11955 [Nocardiopsis sp. CNR-923]|uniref:hypothetical protein n=1 Tax=Nocardiopsis sp. CNR-923 TaxID=1904965 RepID=UPI00095A8A4E|nr:hypothetical protein [Nocardiopsis sp. CNR-923]OLT29298.1 hypothetical protein BJF83_11955 [Nocardiopsis sp. CNR-923]
MTVHIVSVGISLRDFFERGHLERMGRVAPGGEAAREYWKKDKLGLAEGIYDTTGRLNAAFGPDSGVDLPSRNAIAVFQELAQDVQARRWTSVPGLSAELDTVRTYNPTMVADEDLTVLLSSDNEDGRACAVWTAIALAKGDAERVLYLCGIGPDTRLVRPGRGQILVLCVEGLDAHQDAEFAQAMEGLGYLARLLVGNRTRGIDPLLHPDEQVLFHLSGGYRATVPYLIATAEWLRSLGRDAQAHVLPENAGRSVPVPLRSMSPRLVGLELAGFGAHTAPTVPEGPASGLRL